MKMERNNRTVEWIWEAVTIVTLKFWKSPNQSFSYKYLAEVTSVQSVKSKWSKIKWNNNLSKLGGVFEWKCSHKRSLKKLGYFLNELSQDSCLHFKLSWTQYFLCITHGRGSRKFRTLFLRILFESTKNIPICHNKFYLNFLYSILILERKQTLVTSKEVIHTKAIFGSTKT